MVTQESTGFTKSGGSERRLPHSRVTVILLACIAIVLLVAQKSILEVAEGEQEGCQDGRQFLPGE
jgi:hypothetical protein